MPSSQQTSVQNSDSLWAEIKLHGGGLGIKNKYYSVGDGVWVALACTSYGKNMPTIKIDGVCPTVDLT